MSIMSKGIYMMKNNLIKARGFHIVTKQSYLSEDKIKNVLNRYKTITSWAYILHDKEIDERESIWAEIDKIEKQITDKQEVILEEVLPEVFAIMKDTARRFAQNSWSR